MCVWGGGLPREPISWLFSKLVDFFKQYFIFTILSFNQNQILVDLLLYYNNIIWIVWLTIQNRKCFWINWIRAFCVQSAVFKQMYTWSLIEMCVRFMFMVFNTNFNNISVVTWRSVLFVEETEGPGENHRLVQVTDKFYQIMLYTSPWSRSELTISVVICTDCISSCKSNYHTNTTRRPLILIRIQTLDLI